MIIKYDIVIIIILTWITTIIFITYYHPQRLYDIQIYYHSFRITIISVTLQTID